jgi:hypothetical protein
MGSDSSVQAAEQAPPAKERTIFVLYIPGGAMLGIIPALVLNQLEKLTETSVTQLFQVFDGVSTGSILVAGLNMRDPEDPTKPMLTAYNGFELFCKHGPRYFPEIPGRMTKMWVANALNIFIDYVDPSAADELAIDEIKGFCAKLAEVAPWEYRERVQRLEELGTSRWLTKATRDEFMGICEELKDISDEVDQLTGKIGELLFLRTSTGKLGIVFKKSAIHASKFILNNYAHDYMFDPKVPLENYQSIMGDRRLSDALRSIYVSAYDIRNGKAHTFFCRKEDFFSLDPNTPSVTSANDNKLWDIIMASTANPFAYPPHITEDGVICSDKAPVHTPLNSIQDVLDHKPADAKVKLVVLGTGHYLSKDQNMDGDAVRERYIKYGVAGNLIKGREIAELEHYVMSMMRDTIRTRLGNENIIEISPRMSPHTKTEMMKFPSKDALDSSKQNIEKIVQRAQDLIVEEDPQIRNLAQMLIDNLHNLGQMDDEKYARISAKIGVRAGPEEFEEDHNEQNEVVDRNVPPGPGKLKRAFMMVTNFFRPRPRPPQGPKGPGL